MWVAIAVVLVLLIGGGVAAVILVNNNNKDKGGNSATGGGPAATQTPNKPVVEHLTTPNRIGNLVLNDTGDSDTAPAGITDSIEHEIGTATDSMAALYKDSSNTDNGAIVIAATGKVSDPDSKVDDLFHQPGEGTVGSTHTVNAGQLSGTAKCGSSTDDGEDLYVCAWADPGSLGEVLIIGQTGSAARVDLPGGPQRSTVARLTRTVVAQGRLGRPALCRYTDAPVSKSIRITTRRRVGVADLDEAGVLEDLTRPHMEFAPRDDPARLRDHRVGLERPGTPVAGEVDGGGGERIGEPPTAESLTYHQTSHGPDTVVVLVLVPPGPGNAGGA